MVRNYKRKKEISYTQYDLMNAVEMVRKKRMSSYEAATTYGIPRSTIIHRVYGTRGAKMPKPGRPTQFSKELEEKIASHLHIMEKCGLPLTKKEFKFLVADYIRRNGIITCFKDNTPGEDWLKGFRKRNNISLKKPQSVEISRRKACNPFIVYDYFNKLEQSVRDLDLIKKPQNIYNLDETSFCSDPSKSKVMGIKGYRSTRTTSSPGRDNTTVLLAANALGQKLPALIVFQGTFLWSEWVYDNETIKTAYAVSKKGWMETTLFEKYIRDVFLPAIGPDRPVLLIYDGHSSHVDLNVIELAVEERITILKLPPHSSDVLQPLDCSVMKSMKDRWEEKLVKWQRLHVGIKLPKKCFAKILTEIWDNLNPTIIQNGFRRTGIYPVDRNAITKDKFDALSWSEWENRDQNLTTQQNQVQSQEVQGQSELISPLEQIRQPQSLFNLALSVFNKHSSQEQDNSSSIINKWVTIRDPKSFILNKQRNCEKEGKTFCHQVKIQILDDKTFYPTAKQNIPLNNESTKSIMLDNLAANVSCNKENERVSFEELLLKTVGRKDIPKNPRKRLTGAEILTAKDVINRIKTEKKEKEEKQLQKYQRKLKKRNSKVIPKESQRKKIKKKPKKKELSDSESTCSYTSRSSDESEDIEVYRQNLLMEEEELLDKNLIEVPIEQTEHKKRKEVTLPKRRGNLNRMTSPVPSSSRMQHVAKVASPKKGDFILAKFKSSKGKKMYKYVCLVEESEGEKYVIKGFKSQKNKKIFKSIENDISIIDKDDIVMSLPSPIELTNENDSLMVKFSKDIDVAEFK